VLADGMGGHPEGEVAAQIAIQTVSALFQREAKPALSSVPDFLASALLAAHHQILRYASDKGMADSPRTTLVMAVVQDGRAHWIHCGDSRLYWVRRNQILARTRDHSHIEYLIERGRADPLERATHPDRNKLYNCLGAPTPPKIELSARAGLQPGDMLLLCSDGLWSMLPDSEIVHRLSGAGGVVSAVPEMVNMAAAVGGAQADNTTALGIMWQGADAAGDGEPNVISTQMLAEDHVSTTIIAAEPAPGEADGFGEDDIEKAIAEIRAAIEKSSQLLK